MIAPSENPTVEVRLVTPEWARSMLAKNPDNRKVRDRRVIALAAEMDAGRWKLNNDMICIGPDGQLKNGQHRLEAVVLSGASVDMWIYWNYPEDARAVTDTGSPMAPRDHLTRFTDREPTTLAAIVGRWVLCEDGYASSVNPTPHLTPAGRIQERYLEDKDLFDALVDIYTTSKKVMMRGAYGVFSYRVLQAGYPLEVLANFMSDVGFAHLTMGEDQNIAVKLRNSLIRKNAFNRRAWQQTALVTRAFNYWVEGRHAVRLTAPKGDVSVVPAGQKAEE